MASRATTSFVLLVVVAMAGLADVLASAARLPTSSSSSSSSSQLPTATDMEEVNGMMECMIGCFTQVFGCAFGCMGKGPDLPLCVVSCNQKSIVCMLRCAITPSPPAPTPTPTPPAPTPTPKPPKPSPPKPPKPSPPYAGRSAETLG